MSASNDEIQKLANQALQAALHEADAGRPAEAGELYRAVLELQPERAEAHLGLGLLERQAGNVGAAIPHFANALQAAPEQADYWLAYLDTLMEARQFVTARELIALGRSQGLQGPELDAFEQRLAKEGEPQESEIEAAATLYAKGKKKAAGKLAQAFTERFPQHPFGWKLLGGVLHGERAYPEALEAMRKAANYGPEDAETLCNLGLMLKDAGLLEETQSVLERALALEPDSVRALNYLAATLHEMGKLTEAQAVAGAVLALEPDNLQALSSQAVILDHLGRSSEAIETYRRVLRHSPTLSDVHGNMVFCMSHMENFSAEELFQEHLLYAKRLEKRLGRPRVANTDPDPERVLRVGFVSGDLRNHAIASFIDPLFRQISGRPGLILHAYYNHPISDETTLVLRSLVAQWRDVARLDDEALDALIREDRIDILIDLSGPTGYNRLPVFARKPAPIQISWLGYPGTTGLSAMDYYFSDAALTPPGRYDHLFTEALVQLPRAVPFAPRLDAPDVNDLPALTNGYITFGSFNRVSKVSRKVIALWCRLLRALPDARLLVAGMPEAESSQEQLQAWLREEGIDPARTSFHRRSGIQDYLALHGQIDICLDTFPYTGGTTSIYALYMGVPMLTLAGDTVPGRQTLSLLTHHGLEEFIAHDEGDFVAKGVAASGDLARLAHIRATVRDISPLWTPEGITGHAESFERALRLMWQRRCAGLPPASFQVPRTGE